MHPNLALARHVLHIVAAASILRLVDSSEEDADLSDSERLSNRRAPRKKNLAPVLPPHKIAPRPPPRRSPSKSYRQPNWSWVPGHYVPSQATGTNPWVAGPPPSYAAAPWSGQSSALQGQAVVDLAPDSAERLCRRKRKVKYDLESRQRATAGRKPNQVFVLPGGEVDVTCEGKNPWDEALRELVPKCLDMSCRESSTETLVAQRQGHCASSSHQRCRVGQPEGVLEHRCAEDDGCLTNRSQ